MGGGAGQDQRRNHRYKRIDHFCPPMGQFIFDREIIHTSSHIKNLNPFYKKKHSLSQLGTSRAAPGDAQGRLRKIRTNKEI